jgi:hypothetical protein
LSLICIKKERERERKTRTENAVKLSSLHTNTDIL